MVWALFFAPLRARSAGGGGGGAGGDWAPSVSGETPTTLLEERTVLELLPPSTLLPRSDNDDSSELGEKEMGLDLNQGPVL